MDSDTVTALDLIDNPKPKLILVKGASIYSESKRGGPIYKETNDGEVTLMFEFFKTTTPSEQAWFIQKIEEAVVDIIREHSRMETWTR